MSKKCNGCDNNLSFKLDKRITFQKKVISKSVSGRAVETWDDVATVWASVEPLRGREFYQAAAVNAELTIRFRIRYRKGITPDMRITYDGRNFEISQPPIDPLERHRELELMCKEVIRNG